MKVAGDLNLLPKTELRGDEALFVPTVVFPIIGVFAAFTVSDFVARKPKTEIRRTTRIALTLNFLRIDLDKQKPQNQLFTNLLAELYANINILK